MRKINANVCVLPTHLIVVNCIKILTKQLKFYTKIIFMSISKILKTIILTLAIFVQMQAAFAQTAVKGTVTDTAGAAIHGVTVMVKGTKNGTSTGADGTFSIPGGQGAVLVFSYVGYTTQEVAVKSAQALTVQLKAFVNVNTEVVVTALGIKKEKRTIGFATQEVKGAAMEKAREPNVISSLTGKVAGLTIYNGSTLFENQSIYLRGIANPLIVVDGIATQTPNNGWNLNPDDIDNVTVLKSNAAALLYGALGKNGALQITTKKGKAGANGSRQAR